MKKRILVLISLCIFLLVGSAKAQSLVQWMDTYTGMHSFFVFRALDSSYVPLSDATLAQIAPRYAFGWGFNKAAVRNNNANFVNSVYSDGVQAGAPNSAGCGGNSACDRAYFLANHPEYLLYKCDQTTVLVAYSYEAHILNFTSADVQAFRWTNSLLPIYTSAPVIGFDNSLLDNDFQPDLTGQYGHACGYKNPGYIALFNGQGSYGEVNDPQYTNGLINYFASMRTDYLLPVGRRIMPNTDPKIVYNNPTYRTALINTVDGILTEGSTFGSDWIGDTRQFWLGGIKFLEDMETAGKPWFPIQIQANANTYAQLSDTYAEFTTASWSLGRGHTSALLISDNQNETDLVYWPLSFDAANLMGAPCGARTQPFGTVGVETPAVYMRQFTTGISIVNTDLNSSHVITLPNNHTYVDKNGASVTSPVSMAALTGKLLIDTSGIGCDGSQVIAPIITNISSGTPSTTSFTATWTTDVASDSQVCYWLVITTITCTTLDATQVTSHSVSVTGLLQATTYTYNVKSRGTVTYAGLATSSDQLVTTASAVSFVVTTASPLPQGTKSTAYIIPAMAASGGNLSGGGTYTYKHQITLPQVAANQTNFTVPIYGTNADLATFANGGFLFNAQGYDRTYSTAATCDSGFLKWEAEYWDNTGVFVDWVKTSLSSSATTIIYRCFSASSITSSQEDPVNTWDTNVKYRNGIAINNTITAADSTTNNANGTISNVTLATGKLGKAGTFSGNTSYITSPDASPLQITGAMTISCWINFTTSQLNRPCVGKTDGVGSYFLEISYNSANKILFGLILSNGMLKVAESASTYNNSAWHQIVGTWNGSTNVLLYVDGALVTTGDSTAGPVSTASGVGLTIGCFDFNECFNNNLGVIGTIDEVRVENTQRDANYIATRYAAENSSSWPTTGAKSAVSGGNVNYTWDVSAGTICGGLTLNADGTITGTPTTVQTCTFTARATDAVMATATKSMSLTINDVIVPAPNPCNFTVYVGGQLNQLVTASGGTTPYIFSLQSGSLPPGITLGSQGGLNVPVSGTVTSAGSYAFVIRVTDSASTNPAYTDLSCNITSTTITSFSGGRFRRR